MTVSKAVLKHITASVLSGAAMVMSAVPASSQELHYSAPLRSVNPALADDITGEVQFTVTDKELEVEVLVNGVTPDTMHWQLVHGTAI